MCNGTVGKRELRRDRIRRIMVSQKPRPPGCTELYRRLPTGPPTFALAGAEDGLSALSSARPGPYLAMLISKPTQVNMQTRLDPP